jgi:hypothetical protein
MKDQHRFRNRNRPVLAPGEYKRRRRERRMERTLHSEAVVRGWADQHGFTLRVLNNGHHWILEKPGIFAEWWPRSAKLALNRDYLRTYHAPHWPDVALTLEGSCSSGTSA